MTTDYDGIKYYGPNDYSFAMEFKNAKQILDSFDASRNYENLNEVLELFNIHCILEDGRLSEEAILPYINHKRLIMKSVALFFKAINNENIIGYYDDISIDYIEDFWTLFDKFRLYERISDRSVKQLMNKDANALHQILKSKRLVIKYDSVVSDVFRYSEHSAKYIAIKFLEKKSKESEQMFLPLSVSPEEYETILQKYVDSGSPNVRMLQLISYSQSNAECPISDKLRLSAKKRERAIWDSKKDESLGFSYGVGVSIEDNKEIVSFKEIKPMQYSYIYDKAWLENNLDYPTILNNFIYLFGFVDQCMRCSFTSKENNLGLFERIFASRGAKSYTSGVAFQIGEMKSSAELQTYIAFLQQHGIQIEEVIDWFFKKYLHDEFNVTGFVVNMPSNTYKSLDKCRIIPSELDGIFKQFKLYAEEGEIDRELLEIYSNSPTFKEIPSIITNKYAYAVSNEIKQEQHLLFSNQSLLNYMSQTKEYYDSLFDVLNKREKTAISDFPEFKKSEIEWLVSRKSLFVDDNGVLTLNLPRVIVLKDLYLNEVICPHYYRNKAVIDELAKTGEIELENTLFSRLEQDYLNYLMNKSDFQNGPELRNRYIHGTYPINQDQNDRDYIAMLKIMIITIIKINEEFCLKHPIKE